MSGRGPELTAARVRLDAGRSVDWVARQRYIAVLQRLKLEVSREMDRAQVGALSGEAFGAALVEGYDERDRYVVEVAEAASFVSRVTAGEVPSS